MELTTPELLAVLGLLFTVGSSGVGMWWAMMRKITLNGEAQDKKLAGIKEELHEHKLHAASNFVTASQMRTMADDIARRSQRVEDKVDGVHERLDNVLAMMAKQSKE